MGPGSVLQVVHASTGEYLSSGVAIPVDNTIPQNTEGVEILTVSITPKSASSLLIISTSILINGDAGGYTATVALFQDSVANAIAVGSHASSSSRNASVSFAHKMVAGTTSAITFKVRGGTGSGTFKVNGDGSRLYGGVASSTITVTEVAA
jgi:hypothetical protein